MNVLPRWLLETWKKLPNEVEMPELSWPTVKNGIKSSQKWSCQDIQCNLEILLDDYISREGLSDMPLAIAIKNALMRIRGSITEKAKADDRQIQAP